MRRFLVQNGLGLVVLGLFLLSMAGQAYSGFRVDADDRRAHHQPAVGFAADLKSPHFREALSEKWESEFHIADLRWDHSFGSATTSRVAVTVEHDSTEVPDGLSTDFRLAGRAQITHRFSEELKWETGINGSRDNASASAAEAAYARWSWERSLSRATATSTIASAAIGESVPARTAL